MFGYVTANKPELKIREFARYKGYYCGLCHTLLENHGRRGQMTLTYDMTFLVILLSSLYEPKEEEMRKRCLIHPAKKQYMIQNEVSVYASDMNILLTYDHLKDDWDDERKISGFFGMKVFAAKKKKIEKKYVDEIIDTLGIRTKLENLPSALSGGQQQRVAIARALAAKPAILLADEPTGNLDSKTSQDVLGLLKVTSKRFHQTIVMITHNEEIAQMADRILQIEDGKIVSDSGLV